MIFLGSLCSFKNQLRALLLFSLWLLNANVWAQSQNGKEIVDIQVFETMSPGMQRDHMAGWMKLSETVELPAEIEEQAIRFYRDANIPERIHLKTRIFLQTICNTALPLAHRINACQYLLKNQDHAQFPLALVKELLAKLRLQSK